MAATTEGYWIVTAEGNWIVPATAEGIPVSAPAEGIPVAATAEGISVPATADGIPVHATAGGISVPATAEGIPVPATAEGIPVLATAEGSPVPASGSGLSFYASDRTWLASLRLSEHRLLVHATLQCESRPSRMNAHESCRLALLALPVSAFPMFPIPPIYHTTLPERGSLQRRLRQCHAYPLP